VSEKDKDPEEDEVRVENAKSEILKRQRFQFNLSDLIKGYCCFIPCRIRKKKLKVLKNKNLRRHKHFNLGVEKLEQELEIVPILKSLRKMDMITSTLLS